MQRIIFFFSTQNIEFLYLIVFARRREKIQKKKVDKFIRHTFGQGYWNILDINYRPFGIPFIFTKILLGILTWIFVFSSLIYCTENQRGFRFLLRFVGSIWIRILQFRIAKIIQSNPALYQLEGITASWLYVDIETWPVMQTDSRSVPWCSGIQLELRSRVYQNVAVWEYDQSA